MGGPRRTGQTFHFHVVTKEDVGVGAPYVIGVFSNPTLAKKACTGAGRFVIHSCDPNRVYPKGSLLDCALIDNLTADSIRTLP